MAYMIQSNKTSLKNKNEQIQIKIILLIFLITKYKLQVVYFVWLVSMLSESPNKG